MRTRRPSQPRQVSPTLAAICSFILPGLGQVVAGRPRRGLLVAIPALAVAATIVWFALFNRRAVAEAVLKPDWLMTFLIVDLVLLAYHVWAIADAFFLAGGSLIPEARRPGVTKWLATAAVGILIFSTIGAHGYMASNDMKLQQVLADAFNPCGPEWLGQGECASPNPSASPEPTVKPGAWADDGQLNLLMVGTDAGSGRWSLRTDTMILLQVDLSTGKAAMYGIPRNIVNVPLPAESADAFACHCFPDMLSSLYRYAQDHPQYFPGSDSLRGFRALEGAVGELTGLKVDGSVIINLMGFVRLVDALGGVTINVPSRIEDKAYPTPEGIGNIHIVIEPGVQHMDGHKALAYARSRHQDSDYGRMARQQAVLLAIREQISHPCSLVTEIPSLLDAAKGTFWTNMPLDSASQLLAVMERIGGRNVGSYTLVPATTGASADVLTDASIAKIRKIVAHGLDTVPSSGGGGGGGGGGGFSC